MSNRSNITRQCRDLGLRLDTRLALVAACFAPTGYSGIPSTADVANVAGWLMAGAYSAVTRTQAILLSTYGEEDQQNKRQAKGEFILYVAALLYPDGHVEGAELVRVGKKLTVRLVDVELATTNPVSVKRPFYAHPIGGSELAPHP